MRKETKEKVLQQTNVNSYGKPLREKTMEFISVLPDQDPEVQSKALEQFPELISAAKEALSGSKENSSEMIKSADKGLESLGKSYQRAIEHLGGMLDKEEYSPEQKMEIGRMIAELPQEQSEELAKHRDFLEGVQIRSLTSEVITMILGVAALGVKVRIPKII